ncbi:hypothetical protein LSAT2_029465 [Lamellibrachia satsuma]|nr:hypothetical protein LSAT2_029465 [Lamellibrachia satsuma]
MVAVLITGLTLFMLGIIIYTGPLTFIGMFARLPPDGGAVTRAVVESKSALEHSAAIIIAFGVCMMLFALCALWGVCHKSMSQRCCAFVLCLIIGTAIVAMSVTCLVLCTTNKDRAIGGIDQYMNGTLEYYTGTLRIRPDSCTVELGEKNIVSWAWDLMMLKFDCCGFRSNLDFMRFSPTWKRNATCYGTTIELMVPPTCCIREPNEPVTSMAELAS